MTACEDVINLIYVTEYACVLRIAVRISHLEYIEKQSAVISIAELLFYFYIYRNS